MRQIESGGAGGPGDRLDHVRRRRRSRSSRRASANSLDLARTGSSNGMSRAVSASAMNERKALNLVPMVVEQTARGERAYDIYSRLLKERRDLRRRSGRGLHGERHRRPAAVPRVGEPGEGHPPVHQLAGRLGQRGPRDLRHDAVHQAGRQHDLHRQAASMGAVLLAGGAKGKRFMLPNSRDDPPALGGFSGPGHRHRASMRARSCWRASA